MGWELHVPWESTAAVYASLMSAGAEFGLVNAGYRAIDSLSIEKGYRHWHADLRLDDDPFEAGLGFTCKLKTPVDFLGRAALELKKKAGLRKKLVCLTIDEPVPLWGLEAIWRDDRVVGFLRRAEYGFTLKKSLGYGYVSRPDGLPVTKEFLETGDFRVESMDVQYAARVHLKSPFDPQNKRVQGFY